MDPATLSLATSLGGNLASGLGSFLGGQSQSNAASEAARQYAKTMQDALNFQKGVYSTAQGQYDPFIQTGTRGLTDYEQAIQNYTQPTLGYTQTTFDINNWKDPGYDFRMSEAQKAIDASTASKGMTLGSGALKSLQQRGQYMASQEYANAFDRWKDTSDMLYRQASGQYDRDINFENQNISNLGNLTNVGSGAIGNLATLGSGIGSNLMTGYSNIGDALAGATMAGGQANAAGWNTLGKGLSTGLSSYADWYKNRGTST